MFFALTVTSSDQVRSCFRHGHGSLYYSLSSLLSLLSLPGLYSVFSSHHFHRSCLALYAHVQVCRMPFRPHFSQFRLIHLALLTKASRLIKKYRKNRVGFCDSITGITLFCLRSVLATNCSSFRFTFYPSHHRQTLHHVLVF